MSRLNEKKRCQARPDIDAYFLTMAIVAAQRSTCVRRSVGAVLTYDRHILATGYVGSVSGAPHCTDVGCLLEKLADGDERCIRTLHAEQNAILQAARHGIPIIGATLYSTHCPCHVCARLLAGAGIHRVVYISGTPSEWSEEIFKQAGIMVKHYGGELPNCGGGD